MDKKVINTMVQDLVEEVAKENGLTEHEARTFIGVAFRRNRAAFKSTVLIPTLEITGAERVEA